MEFSETSPKPGTRLRVRNAVDDDLDLEDSDNLRIRREHVSDEREYSIDIASAVRKVLSSNSSVDARIATKFGWNMEYVEFGPGLSLGRASNATSVGIEGFLDFNFFRNLPGENFIPGMVLDLNYAYSAGANTFGGDMGIFMKFWFLGESASALRVDAKFGLAKTIDVSPVAKYFALSLGIQTYF